MNIEIIKGDDNPVAEFFSSPARPTPETDAFAIKFKTPCGEKYWVPVDLSRRLERERDEAREALRAFSHDKKHLCDSHRDKRGNCIVCQMEGTK